MIIFLLFILQKILLNLLPQEFIDHYLIDLNVKHVVAGFDYSYGRMGKGTMETMLFHSRNQFTFSVIGKLKYGEEKISSTSIRACIHNGEMEKITKFLGRFYTTLAKSFMVRKEEERLDFRQPMLILMTIIYRHQRVFML